MIHDEWRWRNKPAVDPTLESLRRVSKNGGRSSALRYAQVVDGKLVTMGEIAKRIKRSSSSTAKLLREMPRPLTWTAIEAAANNPTKKEP